MPNSKRYGELKSSLNKLSKALLPSKLNETGIYKNSETVHLRTASFRLLMHAEIESFLEDRAHDLFSRGWEAWQHYRIPNMVTIGLLAYADFETFSPPSRLGGDPDNQRKYQDIHDPIAKAQSNYRAAIRRNHGIKEENILRLFLPLGIQAANLDTTLLADLSSFGEERGNVAHNSQRKTTFHFDPQQELKKVSNIIEALKELDGTINSEVTKINRAISAKKRLQKVMGEN